jgi:hypothetical protein
MNSDRAASAVDDETGDESDARSFATNAAAQQQQADSVWARRFSSEFQQSLRKSIKLLSDRGQWWFAEAWVQKDDGYVRPPVAPCAADSSDFFFFFFFFFFRCKVRFR